jgi:hypothetical protein
MPSTYQLPTPVTHDYVYMLSMLAHIIPYLILTFLSLLWLYLNNSSLLISNNVQLMPWPLLLLYPTQDTDLGLLTDLLPTVVFVTDHWPEPSWLTHWPYNVYIILSAHVYYLFTCTRPLTWPAYWPTAHHQGMLPPTIVLAPDHWPDPCWLTHSQPSVYPLLFSAWVNFKKLSRIFFPITL